MISIITSAQVYKHISPVVRNTMTQLCVYRLRNYVDLQAIVEETYAVYDPKTLLQLCHEAVSQPYAFLYINLMQRDKGNMFMNDFAPNI